MVGLYKRMCILKEYSRGFSTKAPLSGVVRVEFFNGRTKVQVSLINFCPLSEGNYSLFLIDKAGNKYLFPLSESGGVVSILEPFCPEKGFCALIVFLHTPLKIVACGQYGSGNYDLSLLLDSVYSLQGDKKETNKKSEKQEKYDDEEISTYDYFRDGDTVKKDAGTEGDVLLQEEKATTAENERVFDEELISVRDKDKKIKKSAYYYLVKDELEHLFLTGEEDYTLQNYISNSEWVRTKDGVLVGVIREDTRVLYLAYALPTDSPTPPKDLDAVYFKAGEKGYFLLFQDADTGEKLKLSSC